MAFKKYILFIVLTIILISCNETTTSQHLSYPTTKTVNEVMKLHGTSISDPYRWLEDVDLDETKSWVKSQDSLTRDFVRRDSITYLKIENRYKELINVSLSDGEPRKANGTYFYYSSNTETPGIYIKEKTNGKGALLLAEKDSNPGEGIGWPIVEFEPSHDGRYLAYAVGENYSQWNTWRILDVETGKHLPDIIEGMYTFHSPLKWNKDNTGFFYSRFDLPSAGNDMLQPQNQRVMFHRLNTLSSEDRVIFKSPDGDTGLNKIYVSSDGKRLTMVTSGMQVNDVYCTDLSDSAFPVKQIIRGKASRNMYVTANQNVLILATSHESPRRSIVRVNLEKPSQSNWETLIPEDDNMTINNVNFIGNKIIVEYSKDLISVVKIYNENGVYERDVELPYIGWLVSRQSTAYMTCFLGSKEDNEAFFGMQTIFDPGSVFRLDVNTGKVEAYSRSKTSFDPNAFTTEQIFYNSKDGTKVPMYILYKNDKFRKDGSMPVWLYAYGFNWAAKLFFTSVDIIEWMEMGGIYAYPGIRGGSEYGQEWIESGSKRNKQNAIDDYVFAAKHLINENYTSKGKVVANGGSASGPLPAAAMNQVPELWSASIIDIPLLDMLRMYDYQIGPITSGWGDLNNKEDFKALYQWSPYQNIENHAYPPTLVTVGELDQQAVPMHGYKFVAALQSKSKNTNPSLLLVGWGNRHNIRGRNRINRLSFAAECLGMDINFD